MKEDADPASRGSAQQVLAAVLDQTLRLLHPFVPFLTETLWTQLNELAKTRGLDAEFANSDLLVHAQWPTSNANWTNTGVEAQITTMQEWCVSIREARARYQIPPRQKVEARFQADGETAEVLQATCPLLANMAGLDSPQIGPEQQRTKDSATVVVGTAKVYLLGVVDLEKEKAKLEKEAGKLEGQIGGVDRKLSNEGFLAKAPPAVVEKEREQLIAMRAQLDAIKQSLSEL